MKFQKANKNFIKEFHFYFFIFNMYRYVIVSCLIASE